MELPLIESFNDNLKKKSFKITKEKFEKFVSQNKIKYETIKCLCGNSEHTIISEQEEYGIPQTNVICNSCGLIYSNPRLDQESYKLFYSSDIYREIYDGNLNFKEINKSRFSQHTGRYIYEIITSNTDLSKNFKILDFGCGGGWNLIPFISFGCECLGLDYSESLVKIGQDMGLPLKNGGISDIENKFDVIILSHVFEHFLNPIQNLKQILNHLNPKGIIYIEVPNINNLSPGQMHLPHTYCYSPTTFKYYVEKSGLKTIDFGGTHNNYHMYGVFEFSESETVLPKPEFKSALSLYKKFILKEKIKYVLKKIYLFNIFKKMFK